MSKSVFQQLVEQTCSTPNFKPGNNKAAKAAGCRTANGLGMLLYQGASALELWSGQPAPIEVMRRALESNVYGETQS